LMGFSIFWIPSSPKNFYIYQVSQNTIAEQICTAHS
jgi:hypothetical protein